MVSHNPRLFIQSLSSQAQSAPNALQLFISKQRTDGSIELTAWQTIQTQTERRRPTVEYNGLGCKCTQHIAARWFIRNRLVLHSILCVYIISVHKHQHQLKDRERVSAHAESFLCCVVPYTGLHSLVYGLLLNSCSRLCWGAFTMASEWLTPHTALLLHLMAYPSLQQPYIYHMYFSMPIIQILYIPRMPSKVHSLQLRITGSLCWSLLRLWRGAAAPFLPLYDPAAWYDSVAAVHQTRPQQITIFLMYVVLR